MGLNPGYLLKSFSSLQGIYVLLLPAQYLFIHFQFRTMWLRWSTFVQAPNCKNRPQLKKITITNISFNTNWLYSCAEIQPTRRVICKKCCAALFIWDLKKTLVVIGKKIAWKFWICFLWKRSVSSSFTFFWKNVLNSSWVIFSSSSESKVKKLCILPALRLSECESWLTELSWPNS